MPDNLLVVALLKEYKDEASVTRTEVARMLGKRRGYVAGICRRHGIAPWPEIPKNVIANRDCQFPIGIPDTEEFRLCGKRKAPGHSLLCEEHEGKKWVPNGKIIPLRK